MLVYCFTGSYLCVDAWVGVYLRISVRKRDNNGLSQICLSITSIIFFQFDILNIGRTRTRTYAQTDRQTDRQATDTQPGRRAHTHRHSLTVRSTHLGLDDKLAVLERDLLLRFVVHCQITVQYL